MQKLIDSLKSSAGVWLGGKGNIMKIREAKETLIEDGCAVFPDEFSKFIRHVNGIAKDDACIFGVHPGGGFSDMVVQNKLMNRFDKDTVVILGYNSFDYLVYNAELARFEMRDRVDDQVIEEFGDFSAAVRYMVG